MNPKKFIRVVCEGKCTEPNYFNYIFRVKKLTAAKAIKSPDNSPLGIVKYAKELYSEALRKKYKAADIIIWLAFDKDGHANIPQAFEEARIANFKIAFSNICFEFWILLHYEACQRPFNRGSDIKNHINKTHDKNYDKSNMSIEVLYTKIPFAIKNAEDLIKNRFENDLANGLRPYDLEPYTDVHILVKELL